MLHSVAGQRPEVGRRNRLDMPNGPTLDEPAQESARRSFVFGALKTAVSLGLLWILLSRVDLARLWQTIRTASPVDLAAASRALAALSSLASAHPEIAEVEINPLLVTPTGVLGLDARVILANGVTEGGSA